ncbi:MAG: glutathione S-transferase N-terminal domain-containing protein [Hyphomicrobiales bacterium]|nr:glutathione S-transferase N-terminal domain-containing protein [Hyphomicrobiales bacterium]
MAEYTLHCFAQSGNAYKPALMLELCGADWTPVWVDYFGGATRSDAFRDKLSEMGEVPVLEHDGRKLSQSGIILDYLAEKFGKFGWTNDDERREIYRWILFDNHKFTSYTGTLRFHRTFLKTGETPVTEFLEGRAKLAYGVLDRHLGDRSFIVADRPTIADLSLAGYMFWPEEIGIDFTPFPNLVAWRERLKTLPGWRHPYDLMPGHPLPEKS